MVAHRAWMMAGAVVLLLLVIANLPLVRGLGYRNLAVHALAHALVAEQTGDLPQAEAYATRAMAAYPALSGPLLYRLGIVYQQMGLDGEAVAFLERAHQSGGLSDQMLADILFRLGVYYDGAQESELAALYFQQVLELDARDLPLETLAHANVYLGEIVRRTQGDLPLEREYLERAIHLWLDPLVSNRYLSLIARMQQVEDEEVRRQALEMAIYINRRQSSNVWTERMLCLSYLELGEFTEATAWCQRAVKRAPNNHHMRVAMGRVYAYQGLWADALAEYETALSLDANNSYYRTLARDARAKLADE